MTNPLTAYRIRKGKRVARDADGTLRPIWRLLAEQGRAPSLPETEQN